MNNEALMTKVERTRDDFEDAFWNHAVLPVIREEPGEKRAYDRTARFGEAIIDFARTIPRSAITDRIISQLVGAGTSPELKSQARKLWMEARELHLIFSRIWRSGKMNHEIPNSD
jgi:hypothetical protein